MPNGGVELVKYLSRISKEDVPSVGLYAHGLATLMASGVPIPQSFVVTKEAFFYFLEFAGVKKILEDAVNGKAGNTRRIERAVLDSAFPPVLSRSLEDAYHRISGFTDSYVLVQPLLFTSTSSLPVEWEKQKTALGPDGLAEAIKRTWASALCSPTSDLKAIVENRESISIFTEKIPLEEVSGVMTTSDTITKHDKNLLIEAVYGMWDITQRENIVPDQYIYEKPTSKIVDKHISKQPMMILRQLFKEKAGLQNVNVSSIWQSMQKLNDKYIDHLAKIGELIEGYYKSPCEIKWVYEAGKLWIVAIDPLEKSYFTAVAKETTAKTTDGSSVSTVSRLKELKPPAKPKNWAKNIKTKLIAGRGTGNMAGFVEGVVRKSPAGIKPNEKTILVVPSSGYADEGVLQVVSGLVIDQGDASDPIVIRTNMVGVPAVIGAGIASRFLKDGDTAWIDSVRGTVYTNQVKTSCVKRVIETRGKSNRKAVQHDWSTEIRSDRTATKLYIGIKQLSYTNVLQAETFARFGDGVLVGINAEAGSNDTSQLASFAKTLYMEGKPVIVSIATPEELGSITQTVLSLRNGENIKSIWMALPQYKELDAFIDQKQTVLDLGIRRSSTFRLFATLKTPGILLGDSSSALFESGVDGVVIKMEPIQKALSGRSTNKVSTETAKAVSEFIARVSNKSTDIFVDLGELTLTKATAQLIISAGVYGIITSDEGYFPRLRNLAADIEHSVILKRPNRRLNKRR